MSDQATVTRKFHGAELTVPEDVLFAAWLRQTIGETPPAPNAAPKIGEVWPGQGGVYAGVMRGEAAKQDYHLIVPTDPRASIEEIAWGGAGVEETGALSEFDGAANTEALFCSRQSHPAAQWARELNIDGHSDFYLPARRELSLCYANVPELFEKAWYWSSTQYAGFSHNAWLQYFSDGHQSHNHKDDEFRARAVRRLVF